MTDLLISSEDGNVPEPSSSLFEVQTAPTIRRKIPVAVLLADHRARERVIRVARSATDSCEAFAIATPDLDQLESADTVVICTEDEIELVLGTSSVERVIVCDRKGSSNTSTLCLVHPGLDHVIGWCAFESAPRTWELAFSVRSVVQPDTAAAPLDAIVTLGGRRRVWRPSTPDERDAVSIAVRDEALSVGAPSRIAARLMDIAYELIMNALYDAPTDEHGNYRFAHDRGAALLLNEYDRPVVTFATDGVNAAVEVTDPFGSLQRHRLFESLARGETRGRATMTLDRSHGGAGLGLWTTWSNSLALFAEVVPGGHTSITVAVSLELSPRQYRDAPASIHYKGPR